MLKVLGRACQNLETVVAIVGQEGLAKVGELYSFCILNVKIANECLYFGLGVMNLHREQACCEFQLGDITFSIKVESSEGIHYVEVWTSLEEDILLVFDEL